MRLTLSAWAESIRKNNVHTINNIEWLVLRCLQNHKKPPNMVAKVCIDDNPERWSHFEGDDLFVPSKEKSLRYAEHALNRMKGILPYVDYRIGTDLGYGIHCENLVFEEMIPVFRQEVDEVEALQESLNGLLPGNTPGKARNRL